MLLALAVPNIRTFPSQLASAGCVLSKDYTGSYVAILDDHFANLQTENSNMEASTAIAHRLEAIFTVLCKGDRTDIVWMGCPTHLKQLIFRFRHRLQLDGEEPPMGPIPTALQLFGAVRYAYNVSRALVHAETKSYLMLLNHLQQRIKLIAR